MSEKFNVVSARVELGGQRPPSRPVQPGTAGGLRGGAPQGAEGSEGQYAVIVQPDMGPGERLAPPKPLGSNAG